MWNRWKTRENVKQVETTGKHVTSGKRGKMWNRWDARENTKHRETRPNHGYPLAVANKISLL